MFHRHSIIADRIIQLQHTLCSETNSVPFGPIQDQTISLEHIRTKDMLADPLTKGLPPNVFKEHLAGMGLRESLMIPGYAQKE